MVCKIAFVSLRMEGVSYSVKKANSTEEEAVEWLISLNLDPGECIFSSSFSV